MPPSNVTPATAIDITGQLPYTLTQDMQGAATGSHVASCVGDAQLPGWWKYTTSPNESVFGVRAVSTGDYFAGVSVWEGAVSALTELAGGCTYAGQDSWLVVRGAPLTTYYIQVSTDTPGSVTSPLTFSAVAAPNVTAPAGSLYIMEDNDVGVPGVILDQTTGALLRSVSTAPCEFGAVAPTTGVVCVAAAVPGELYLESIKLYTNQLLTVVADLPALVIANQSWLSPVTHDFDETFYIFQIPRAEVPLTSAVVVVTVTEAGVVGPTFTLPINLGQINGAAISRNGSILYYTTQAAGDQRIRRHDLLTDLPLSDFATFSTRTWKYDLAVLPNDDVLVAYHLNASATTMRVERYNSAGVLQATYDCGTSTGGVPRMALALNETSFWAMTFVSAGFLTYNRLQRIVTATAAVAVTFDVRNSSSSYPIGSFFTPTTCPLLVLQQAVSPPVNAVSYERFHLRRAPHLVAGRKRVRYNRFELDAETGLGLTADPTTAPSMRLRWSDDGGHTWSSYYAMGAGIAGAYKTRLFRPRLGAARDRVFEVSTCDAAAWRLLDAWLDLDEWQH